MWRNHSLGPPSANFWSLSLWVAGIFTERTCGLVPIAVAFASETTKGCTAFVLAGLTRVGEGWTVADGAGVAEGTGVGVAEDVACGAS